MWISLSRRISRKTLQHRIYEMNSLIFSVLDDFDYAVITEVLSTMQESIITASSGRILRIDLQVVVKRKIKMSVAKDIVAVTLR